MKLSAALFVSAVMVSGFAGQGRGEGVQAVAMADRGCGGTIGLPKDASPTVRYTAELLGARIERLCGKRPAVSLGAGEEAGLILATAASSPCPLSRPERDALTEEAYLAKVIDGPRGRRLVLVGGGDRGLLYGAARLADFGLRCEGQSVLLEADGKVHAPALAVRGNYTLACWGQTHLFTRDHWRRIFDAMAADTMNVTMFWLSGLFPSKKHPAAVVYEKSRIGVEDVRAMIRHAHQRGMRFLLGSGVFAWFAVDALAERFPESKAKGCGGMCPSSPLARKLNREYLLEMLDAFPEADGFFLEIRDEYGPCQCPACQRKLDQHGSKGYGQAELSFLRELAEEVWRSHPKATFISSIGYGDESAGAHSGDVLFYEGIRRMSDPRLFWLLCRDNWALPAAGGGRKPIRYFSGNLIQWCQYYRLGAAGIAERARRSRDAGCIGFCPAFEPGFCSASWYSDEVPYPVDRIPYAVTRFAYRESCWDPDMTDGEFRARLLRRFFGAKAPAQLADDLLALFDLIRTESQNGLLTAGGKWPRGLAMKLAEEAEKAAGPMAQSPAGWAALEKRLGEFRRLAEGRRGTLGDVERRLAAAMPQLDPQGRETAALIRRALADTRAELCIEPEAAERVRKAVAHVRQMAQLQKQRLPATVTATSQWDDSSHSAFKALDGDLQTSWLCKDRAPLPQTITITLRQPRAIDWVKVVQGAYHPAYNTRKFRIESSPDGKHFSVLGEGELENHLGVGWQKRFPPVEALVVRVVITSVYPNLEYSSPSLAEIQIGLDNKSWTTIEAKTEDR